MATMDDDTINEQLFRALGGQTSPNGHTWTIPGRDWVPAGDWRPTTDYAAWLDVEREIEHRGLSARYVLALGDRLTNILDVSRPSSPQEDIRLVWRLLRASLSDRARAALDVLA